MATNYTLDSLSATNFSAVANLNNATYFKVVLTGYGYNAERVQQIKAKAVKLV